MMKDKINNKSLNLKTKVIGFMTNKKRGDGHYVAIAVGLILALAIGGIIWAAVGGNNGAINGWINAIITKVTDFINSITG